MNLQQTIEAIRAKVEAIPPLVESTWTHEYGEAPPGDSDTVNIPNQGRTDALALCEWMLKITSTELWHFFTPPSMQDALIEALCKEVAEKLGWELIEVQGLWAVIFAGEAYRRNSPIEALCAALGVEVGDGV